MAIVLTDFPQRNSLTGIKGGSGFSDTAQKFGVMLEAILEPVFVGRKSKRY
jgi:hypothetical protein